MIVYVDASAVVPLIKSEDASPQLTDYFEDLREDGHLLVSCRLLETELRRTAIRQGIDQSTVSCLLDSMNLVEVSPADFLQAGLLPYDNLGSLDAMHLAAALRIPADAMITSDVRLSDASANAGLAVLDTGRPRTLL